MLQPTRTKYRKAHKGRIHGVASRCNFMNYGAYGLNIGRSRNDTFGTNTAVQDGDELGHVTFYGADGTNFDYAVFDEHLIYGYINKT